MRVWFWVRRSVLTGVLISTIGLLPVPALAAAQSATTTAPAMPAVADPYNSDDVQAAVETYFADAPQMIAAARCESGYRQYDYDGSVLDGGSGGMLGVFQISSIHISEALSMGMDIKTLAGNLAYARYLYEASGMDPWISSYDCWGDTAAASPVSTIVMAQTPTSTTTLPQTQPQSASSTQTIGIPATTPKALPSLKASADFPASKPLVLGTISPVVRTVQQMLNRSGFTIATSGPGSKGHETTKFGLSTLKAIQKFQCVNKIACSGNSATTGYGIVGPQTYAALTAALAMR